MNKIYIFLFFIINAPLTYSQCCTYRLSMQDSYGDSWNGATLEIIQNDSSLGAFFAQNFGTTYEFEVCQGDSLKLIYTPGEYENENTYQLSDAYFNTVYSASINPPTGAVFTGIGDCNTVPAPGSNPCNAIVLDSNSCFMSSNTGFSTSGRNPGCAEYLGPDIWFSLQVPLSGNINLHTQNGDINDTGLAAWIISGTDCSQLQTLGCDDDGGTDYYSNLTVYDLTPLQTIYIQVFGYAGAVGSFEICNQTIPNVVFTGSELPIVIITTLEQSIVTNTKVNALMDIKYNGDGNYTSLNDPSNVYSGNIGIEIRGATSAGFPQRPYGFETRAQSGNNLNVSLLGMPAENDWVLLSNFNDRSFIRNTLATKLFAKMGNYSVRMKLCEVLVDSSYKGIYVFGEKIKRDANRINISNLYSFENSGNDLTGGYILQQNYSNANNSFQSNFNPPGHPEMTVNFLYEYPKVDSISAQQKLYIAGYVDSLETALYSTNFADNINGYRKYLEVNSFIDYFIINELSRNNDGFKKSVFYNKNKITNGGKLKAGPVWDFDWAWKNMSTCSIFEGTDGSGWAHQINDCNTDNPSTGWYIRMLEDSTFQNQLKCRYSTYRESFLNTEFIFNYIDSVSNLVENAQVRHFQKWPVLGVAGFSPELQPDPLTYAEELTKLKNWISLRLQWLDENIPGNCYIDYTGINSNVTGNLNLYSSLGSGQLNVSGSISNQFNSIIKIYDLQGRLLHSLPLNSGQINQTFNIHQKGILMYRIENKNGIFQQGKIAMNN